MKARPILFQGDMVRAIIDGRKTQTRRAMKDQPPGGDCRALHEVVWGLGAEKLSAGRDERRSRAWAGFTDSRAQGSVAYYGCPYGQPGDLLWVRETHYVWSAGYTDGSGKHIDYRATEPDSPCGGWTPSIHMPRWASRLTLRVTGVRVERLRNITDADARAEGCECESHKAWGKWPGEDMARVAVENGHRAAFEDLWCRINGPDSWAANPWVWVVEFEPIQANVDTVLSDLTDDYGNLPIPEFLRSGND